MSDVALKTLRCWEIKQSRLVSLNNKGLFGVFAHKFTYEGIMSESDIAPTLNGKTGIYSALAEQFLKKCKDYPKPVAGVLNNRGVIQIHKDGTVRSQSAEICELFIDSKVVGIDQCVALQAHYQVPVTYTDSVEDTVKRWIKRNKSVIDVQSGIAEAFKVEKWDGEENIKVENYKGTYDTPKSQKWWERIVIILTSAIVVVSAWALVFLWASWGEYKNHFIPVLYSTNLTQESIQDVFNKTQTTKEIIGFISADTHGDNQFLVVGKDVDFWSWVWKELPNTDKSLYSKVNKEPRDNASPRK